MGRTPEYDHPLIRKILEETPGLVDDSKEVARRYNEVHGNDAIGFRSVRRIIYDHYKKWFGITPEVTRGYPSPHDVERILWLRTELPKWYPRVTKKMVADLYNGGWTGDHLPATTLIDILEREARR